MNNSNVQSVEYTFSIAYYSEVSAELTLYTDGTHSRLEATHPMGAVPIDDWFHFYGSYDGPDPLVVEGENINDVIAEMGYQLYPGARGLLEDNDTVDNPEQQFYTDLYIAFVYGEWFPVGRKHPSGWEHSVGERLVNR